MDNIPQFAAHNELEKKSADQNLYDQVIETRLHGGKQEKSSTRYESTSQEWGKYDFSDALQKATAYFNGDSLAAGVWVN